jgi:hypothetical protein
MKILVFGGRKQRIRRIVFDALDELNRRFGIIKLVQGGASGIDQDAFLWGHYRLAPKHTYTCHADWTDLSHPDAIIVAGKYGKYDKRAGMRRNAKMLAKYRPDLAVQFPGGHGTAGMRHLLDAAGIRVIEVYAEPFNRPAPLGVLTGVALRAFNQALEKRT